MRLFWKIYVWVFIAFCLAFAFTSYEMVSKQIADLRHQIEDKHRAQAVILVRQVAVGVIEGNWPFEALHALSKSSDFLFWWVVKPDGTIYLADSSKFTGTAAHDYFPRLRHKKADIWAYSDRKRDVGIIVSSLKAKGGEWSFWIGYSLAQISDSARKTIVLALILCIAVIGALGVILFLIIRHFLKPLPRVLEAAASVGDGNLEHRLTVTTEDELGRLADSFNSMVENLRRITVFRDQLEKRVQERTTELTKTNEELRKEIIQREEAEQARAALVTELQDALAQVKTLSGFLPICSSCKKIRDDKGYWQQLESYISEHSEAMFSHSLCPECMKKLYPELINGK